MTKRCSTGTSAEVEESIRVAVIEVNEAQGEEQQVVTTKRTDIDNDMPSLGERERDRRWRRIWAKMDLAGVDCLLVWGNESKWKTSLANIRYITGRPLPGVLLFPIKQDPIIWSGFPHDCSKWAEVPNSWIKDLRPGSPIPVNDILETIKSLGYEKGTIGVIGFGSTRPQVVPDAVLYRPYSKLMAALPDASFIDQSGMLEEMRMIKSPEEIILLERAAELAYDMFKAMVESMRPGVRECEVYANMLQASIKGGGEEDMIWMASGVNPPPHGRRPPPMKRRLGQGDILVVEYHSSFEGYLAGAEHSVSIGEPAAPYRKIQAICEEAHQAATSIMKPGVSLTEVIQALRVPVVKAGMGWVECGFHGHGLASPEFPSCMYGGSGGSWDDHFYAKVPSVDLEEGMVLSTAVDLYDPAWNDMTGLMLGDTILVTKNGPQKMTKVPLELTVV